MKDLRMVSTSVFRVRILNLGKFIHIFELSKAEQLCFRNCVDQMFY